MTFRRVNEQNVAGICEPLVGVEVKSLDTHKLLTCYEQAVVTSISIEITNTRFETIANANLDMLRKEVLRRMRK